ncbi:hypothetical protein N2152v2_006976 [Parachlorella kessleri]
MIGGSPASRQVETLGKPRLGFDPALASVDGVASHERQQQGTPEGQQAGLPGEQVLCRPSHVHRHSSAYVFNPPPEAEAGPGTDATAEDASQSTVLSKLKKWGDYASVGAPVRPTRFIPMKTPLSREIISNWTLGDGPKHSLTVPELIEGEAARGRVVGKIIDLVSGQAGGQDAAAGVLPPLEKRACVLVQANHECLYEEDVPNWVEYAHVQLVAKVLPPQDAIEEVARIANEYWGRCPDKYIAIHCAYGFNRTGFVVCSYLIQCCGLSVEEAMDSFADARPPGVKHEKFIKELYARHGDGRRAPPAASRRGTGNGPGGGGSSSRVADGPDCRAAVSPAAEQQQQQQQQGEQGGWQSQRRGASNGEAEPPAAAGGGAEDEPRGRSRGQQDGPLVSSTAALERRDSSRQLPSRTSSRGSIKGGLSMAMEAATAAVAADAAASAVAAAAAASAEGNGVPTAGPGAAAAAKHDAQAGGGLQGVGGGVSHDLHNELSQGGGERSSDLRPSKDLGAEADRLQTEISMRRSTSMGLAKALCEDFGMFEGTPVRPSPLNTTLSREASAAQVAATAQVRALASDAGSLSPLDSPVSPPWITSDCPQRLGHDAAGLRPGQAQAQEGREAAAADGSCPSSPGAVRSEEGAWGVGHAASVPAVLGAGQGRGSCAAAQNGKDRSREGGHAGQPWQAQQQQQQGPQASRFAAGGGRLPPTTGGGSYSGPTGQRLAVHTTQQFCSSLPPLPPNSSHGSFTTPPSFSSSAGGYPATAGTAGRAPTSPTSSAGGFVLQDGCKTLSVHRMSSRVLRTMSVESENASLGFGARQAIMHLRGEQAAGEGSYKEGDQPLALLQLFNADSSRGALSVAEDSIPERSEGLETVEGKPATPPTAQPDSQPSAGLPMPPASREQQQPRQPGAQQEPPGQQQTLQHQRGSQQPQQEGVPPPSPSQTKPPGRFLLRNGRSKKAKSKCRVM